MAALYLHNALFVSDQPNSSRNDPPPHNRNISTTSSTTLRASTSEHSHPTEPLIHSSTSESATYLDLLSRQPAHSDGLHSGWPTGLTLDGDAITLGERNGWWEQPTARRLRRLKLLKLSLEVLLGAFAAYNTVRYFLAYTKYDSETGQAVCLALGISTGVSFALIICAIILSAFQPYLLLRRTSLRSLLRSQISLHVFSSFFLFGPGVVNLVLLFIWKSSTNPELNIKRRCNVGIDVIWSVSSAQCKHTTWDVWLALSIIRLALTLFIIISYHIISSAYHRTRRPSRLFHRSRQLGPNHLGPYQSHLAPSMTGAPASFSAIPELNRYPVRRRSSDSTLRSNDTSKFSLNHHQTPTGGQPTTYASASFSYSDEEASGESDGNEHTEVASPENSTVHGNGNDRGAIGFVDRFRSIVSQITRETDEALKFAERDDKSGLHEGIATADAAYSVNSLGYDEFGQPYPPDEHVQILNGYVQRMPTIESMGSREMGSSHASSMYTQSDQMGSSRRSTPTFSRRSTHTNALSISDYAGSQPLSRANSITADAGRATEMGELLDRASSGDRLGVQNGSLTNSGSHVTGTGSSYPSTTSYYTATSATHDGL